MKTSLIHVPLIVLLISAPCMGQTMFRGDAAHSGVYPGDGPNKFQGVKWKFPTGDRVVSSPVWSNGVIYFGSDDHNLYAVDAWTGRQNWKFGTQGPVPSTPAVAGGTVCFGSYDGKFYALDAQNGKLKWKFATDGERRFEAKGIHGMQPKNQTIPDPCTCICRVPWSGRERCTSLRATETCTRSTQPRASFAGNFTSAMWRIPRPHYRTAPCTSEAGTPFSMRLMPPPERKSGDSRAATTHSSTITSDFSLRPP